MRGRHIYRSPGEPLPRSTADAGYSTVPVRLGMLPATCPECRVPAGSHPIATFPFRYPIAFNNRPGATSTVRQPPPTSGGTLLIQNTRNLPISPQPSPTVGVPAGQTAPQLTQPGTALDNSGASVGAAATGVMGWLEESTLITGIPNWGLAAAALGAYFLFGSGSGKGRR